MPDLITAERRLRGHRFITLVGPPGVGKSRLAAELAYRTRHAWPGGVWYVGLDRVPGAGAARADIAGALDVTSPALLLLDNCEAALGAAVELVDEMSPRWPLATMLLTSREPVGMVGEALVAVRPLPVEPADVGDPLGVAAVRLFVDRARAVDPSFCLDASNEDAVVRLCRFVDGLPLAIELAAGRTGLFTPGEILERLHGGIDLLSAPGRPVAERHRGLPDAIAWSYRTLGPRARAVFRRLSVLGTRFEVPQAVSVCSGADVPATAVAELVAQLAAKSLISRDGNGFHQLNVVRAFGRAALAAEGEEEAVRGRWVAALAGAVGATPGRTRPTVAVSREILVEACAWSNRQQGQPYPSLAVELGRCLREDGRIHPDDYELMRSVCARTRRDSPWRAPLLMECAALAGWMGDPADALAFAIDGADAARTPDRPGLRARALFELGAAYSTQGELARADSCLRESLALDRAIGRIGQSGSCLYRLAANALAAGNGARAAILARQALGALRAAGPAPMLLLGLHLDGHAALVRGDFDHARAAFTEGLDLAAESRWAAGRMLDGLAVESALRGRVARGFYLGSAARRFRVPVPLAAAGWDRLVANVLTAARAGMDSHEAGRIRVAAERATVRHLSAYARRSDASGDDPLAPPPLTEREREVIALVGHGLTNAQIAGRLGISQRAVAYRLTAARRKLHLRSRTEVAAWAWRNARSGFTAV